MNEKPTLDADQAEKFTLLLGISLEELESKTAEELIELGFRLTEITRDVTMSLSEYEQILADDDLRQKEVEKVRVIRESAPYIDKFLDYVQKLALSAITEA